MGNPYLRPNLYIISQYDILMVYAAFQRSIHHFHALQDASEHEKRKFYSGYQKIFKHVKPFCSTRRGSQSNQESPNSGSEKLFSNLKKFFPTKQEFKDLKYSEEYERWEQEFSSHVENFPTLSNVSNAHVHAADSHYIKGGISALLNDKGRLQFYKNEIMNPFDKCRHWTSSPLKEALMKIPSTERLRWCVMLLVAYHYEDECSIFMSSAFKLCINALNLSPIEEKNSERAVIRTMGRYLILFKNFLPEASLYHLKFLNKCTDYLFYGSNKNFRILLEHGASYGYSLERLTELKWRLTEDLRGMCPILDNADTGPKRQYYCLLVFYINRASRRCYKDDCLRVIWSSIPEPFLTEEDILTCFSHMADNEGCGYWWILSYISPISDVAREVYQWYSDVVAAVEDDVRSPRCLKHLSRCAIRQNMRFPINVDSLQLPQKLKDYLMLKE